MSFLEEKRRPIRTRHTRFAISITNWLAARGFKPNQVSLLSVVFSAFAALCLACSGYDANWLRTVLLVSAIIFILLRLLCNLFDGMLAIEAGAATKSGEIFNDLPDRPSDILILVGAGYAASFVAGGVTLGWITAILAVMTAYIRLLGSAAGTRPYFIGPMAKQHRMSVIMIACVAAIFLDKAYFSWIFVSALLIISAGSIITIMRRLKNIIADLESMPTRKT